MSRNSCFSPCSFHAALSNYLLADCFATIPEECNPAAAELHPRKISNLSRRPVPRDQKEQSCLQAANHCATHRPPVPPEQTLESSTLADAPAPHERTLVVFAGCPTGH